MGWGGGRKGGGRTRASEGGTRKRHVCHPTSPCAIDVVASVVSHDEFWGTHAMHAIGEGLRPFPTSTAVLKKHSCGRGRPTLESAAGAYMVQPMRTGWCGERGSNMASPAWIGPNECVTTRGTSTGHHAQNQRDIEVSRRGKGVLLQ